MTRIQIETGVKIKEIMVGGGGGRGGGGGGHNFGRGIHLPKF